MATKHSISSFESTPDVFAILAKSKPRYTRNYIKFQAEELTSNTSLIDLGALLQDAALTLVRPNMNKRQAAKARKLLLELAMNVCVKAVNDV